MDEAMDLALPGGEVDAVVLGDRAAYPAFGLITIPNAHLLPVVRKLVLMACRTPTERGLVQAIFDDPDDPTLRRVYADFLDGIERYDEAKAERAAADWLHAQEKRDEEAGR